MCEAAPVEDRHIVRGKVILEEGAYIGANAVICVTEKNPVITIGQFSVVGSLSYIDKPIPPGVIVHPRQILVYKKRENQ
jgi:acetyltransferase-like isoleucine patch superfamily enzyme